VTQRQTIWDMLAECVHLLDQPFRASEIVGWFRRHHPEVNESSLRVHIQSATSNVDPKSKAVGLARRTPLLTRIDHGVYVRYAVRPATGDSPPPLPLAMESVGTDRIRGDVILVGCTATKGPMATAAKDLFLGARFVKARAYAEASGRPPLCQPLLRHLAW
jgi:hypothetical protein